MTREQVVKFLIKTDLELKHANNELSTEGVKALVQLCYDDDIKDIEMSDIIKWIEL